MTTEKIEIPEFILKQETLIREEEEKKRNDAEYQKDLVEMYNDFVKNEDVIAKVKFLDDLDINDTVALREIFIKQYLEVHGKLLSNIELITQQIYKSKK